MGPLMESSPMPSRPKVNDEVFSPLQPVTKQECYIIVIDDDGLLDTAGTRASRWWHAPYTSKTCCYKKGLIRCLIYKPVEYINHFTYSILYFVIIAECFRWTATSPSTQANQGSNTNNSPTTRYEMCCSLCVAYCILSFIAGIFTLWPHSSVPLQIGF